MLTTKEYTSSPIYNSYSISGTFSGDLVEVLVVSAEVTINVL